MWLLLLMLSRCPSLRLDVPRVPTHVIDDGERTPLGSAFAEQAAQHPALSGFQVMATGHVAFVARTALADAAERTLDVQYYSVSDDLTSDLPLRRIAAAAERSPHTPRFRCAFSILPFGRNVRYIVDKIIATKSKLKFLRFPPPVLLKS